MVARIRLARLLIGTAAVGLLVALFLTWSSTGLNPKKLVRFGAVHRFENEFSGRNAWQTYPVGAGLLAALAVLLGLSLRQGHARAPVSRRPGAGRPSDCDRRARQSTSGDPTGPKRRRVRHGLRLIDWCPGDRRARFAGHGLGRHGCDVSPAWSAARSRVWVRVRSGLAALSRVDHFSTDDLWHAMAVTEVISTFRSRTQ